MTRKKRSVFKVMALNLIIFVIIFGAVFFGVQFVTKTGIFRIPGVVYYDESLNDSELELLKSIFTEPQLNFSRKCSCRGILNTLLYKKI